MFVGKLAHLAARILERWFLDSLGGEEEQGSGASFDDIPAGDSAGEAHDESSSVTLDEAVGAVGHLIPSLPNSVVRGEVRSSLMTPPLVQLLLLLRRVSKAWDSFVRTTIEWNVWTLVRLDTPDYLRYSPRDCMIYCSFHQRFSHELANYRLLVTEDMDEVACRLSYLRSGRGNLPFYISTDGCPPDFEICLEYYEI